MVCHGAEVTYGDVVTELGRDLGHATWLVAAGACAVWGVLVALAAWRVAPRRVDPGPDALDPVGDEPPALVNLLTGSWSLGREAVPATLLDLASRGYVSIRQQSDLTVVHVPARAAGDGEVRPYEKMVLRHVRKLAGRSSERLVPAPALTTGVRSQARTWWRTFRTAVHSDAIERGLARPRWPGGLKLVLVVTGAVPSLAIGLALATTLVDHGSFPAEDLTPAGLTYAGIVFVGMAVAVGALLRGVTGTPQGYEVAARWLGLRATMSRDPRFTDQTPSSVDVWGRKLAYAAAMGPARSAAAGLPMGADDTRRVWSPVGGSWRAVRVRYPRIIFVHGINPVSVLLVNCLLGGTIVVLMITLFADGSWSSSSPVLLLQALAPVLATTVPTVVRAGLDLLTPRRAVQGRVLRIHERNRGKSSYWFVVVDDGTASQVRPWVLRREPPFGVDAVVRADVSRHLAHVRIREILEPGDAPGLPAPDLGTIRV